ncbi:MAG TPA: malectin domain-containing carbohydrate-binding protein, partial [bacterium]|nr:malectin domain-containing carbohydrate-binding protein [bacterium]
SGSPNSADTGYAGYLVNYIKYVNSQLAGNGISVLAVSPQNEPDWNPTYESALWTAGQFDVFAGALHSSLQSAGLSTRIMIPESFRDDKNLAATAMDDAAIAPFIGVIGNHLYGLNGAQPYSLAGAGFTHLTNQENWETEMSDVSGAANDTSMNSGFQEAGWIQQCIVGASMNAYHAWWLYPTGNTNEALIGTDNQSTKKLWVVGNWSRFVRPGYYRMGATVSPSSGVSLSAFKSDSSSAPASFVIVAINRNNSATSTTFNLNGINATSVTPWVTDASNNLTRQTAVAVSGNSFTYNLNAQSVISFVGAVTGGGGPTATPTLTPVPLSPTPSPTPLTASTWRVNAGGPAYTDSLGNVWSADTQFTAGTTIAEGGTIAGTSDSTLYDTQRYGSNFSYVFHVPAGTYQATLYLAETYSGDASVGARVFSVLVNGVTMVSNLDLYAQGGANQALNQVLNNLTPSAGAVTLQFVSTGGTDANALVEAIQVIPQPNLATPTRTTTATVTATRTPLPPSPTATWTASSTATATATNSPLPATFTPTATASPTPLTASTWRVNAGGPAYTDSLGNAWQADAQFVGGTTIA